MLNLSDAARLILSNLRHNREFDRDGWGCVYLDNARPEGMGAHAFAGHLSALKAAGLYQTCAEGDDFGMVKLDN